LKGILKLIALVPMVRAFDRLPRKVAALYASYLFAHRPRSSHLAIPAHILRQLQHDAAEERKPAPTDLSLALAAIESNMPEYEHVPVMISQRLRKHWTELTEDADAAIERPADRSARKKSGGRQETIEDREY